MDESVAVKVEFLAKLLRDLGTSLGNLQADVDCVKNIVEKLPQDHVMFSIPASKADTRGDPCCRKC